ncbi:MAG: PIG-L family deacetylase [Verrucomicrobia bacterium]|nr:MAG: PIG-L family deacetylase [Verrucomicrobiota bacterium]
MPKVLAAFAHPDDIEFLCAGTLALLVQAGWELRCSTLSGGDLGSPSGTREAIRNRRLKEAATAAESLGGSYAWAGLDDFGIVYDRDCLRKVTDVVRGFAPDIVITHSPDCYMLDHEETSRLVRMACFAAAVPLYETGNPPMSTGVPALYYSDAIEGKDKYGRPVMADFYIDIASTLEARTKALACHESQREWLRSHHGIDDYLLGSKKMAQMHGERCGAIYAEGFRQNLGHGYRQENILGKALHRHLRFRGKPKGPLEKT